jgi:hypothetical protein
MKSFIFILIKNQPRPHKKIGMQGRLVRSWFGPSVSPILAVGRDNVAIAFLSKADQGTHQLFVLNFNDTGDDNEIDTDEYDDDFEEDVGFLKCDRAVDVADVMDFSVNLALASCFDSSDNFCLFGQNQLTKTFWLAVWNRAGDEPVIQAIPIPPIETSAESAKACVAVHNSDCWAVAVNGSLFVSPVYSLLFSMPTLSTCHAVAFSNTGDLFVTGTAPSSERSQVVYKHGTLVYQFEGERITLLSVSEDGSLFCCADAGGVLHTNDLAFVPVGPFGVEVGNIDGVCCTNASGVFICERDQGIHNFI